MPPLAVIAGGLATRLGERTQSTPKVMLPVAGEPFIAHQLRLFRREGIAKVVLCVGHMANQIVDYVGDGANFGLQVFYSYDGDYQIGTGGAIRKALPLLEERFFIIYGDSYLNISYASVLEIFEREGKTGLMTVLHNKGQWDVSNIEYANGSIRAYSKKPTPAMEHIDYGLGIIKSSAFAADFPADPFDLSVIYSDLVARGDMAGFVANERFYEIGSHGGLAETEAYILKATNE